jgi:putative FmdB family regulatory protein
VPTYQYACTACDERLEVVQKFTDDSLTVCETCGGQLRKVYSPVGIVFKGSGFYRTDSRNGSGAAAAKDKDKDKQANGSGDGSSGKSDSSADAGSSPSKSGSADAKPTKKTEKASSGSGTDSKVA